VFGYSVHGHDVRQVDFRLGGAGKLDFCFLSGFFQALKRHGILFQVEAFVFFKFFGQPVNDDLVEIVASQVGIAIGGFHLEYAIAQFQDGNVKGTSTQVEDSDLQIGTLFIKSVSQRGCRGLIDDPLDLQSGDLAGFFGGLTLGIAEIGGYGITASLTSCPR
jgi:hypothetical protein